jgi:S1-C subfamily serine protease
MGRRSAIPSSRPTGLIAAFTVVFLLVVGVAAFVAGRYTNHQAAGLPPQASPKATSTQVKQAVSSGTPAPRGFAALYRQDSSGVLKIVASTCGGTGIGTGFLLPSGQVATVAHVVTGAVSVAITGNGETSAASVVGYDANQDLALLQPSKRLAGHTFRWADHEPSVGDQVAAIGYPLNQPETLTIGTVSGLNRKLPIEGTIRTGLIQTDAALNPGNSGGPLIAGDGMVTGLVDAKNLEASGIGYAVDAQLARPEFSNWQAKPSPQPATACPGALGPSGSAAIGGPASGSDVAGITSTLVTYFDAINTGDYPTGYAQLDAHAQSQGSEQTFASGDATSYDFNFSLMSVTTQSPGVDVAALDFTSVQDSAHGPNGDTCDNWTLTYTMVNVNGTWLIDSATGQNGVTHTSC